MAGPQQMKAINALSRVSLLLEQKAHGSMRQQEGDKQITKGLLGWAISHMSSRSLKVFNQESNMSGLFFKWVTLKTGSKLDLIGPRLAEQ